DFNCLKFPDRDQAMEKILDLTMLSDIFPTGYHGAYTAGVTTGSTVYVAGAGPVGLAAAHAAQLLGAAVVIVGDLNRQRLEQARSFGCETVDISQDATLEDQVAEILGTNEVDCAVDAVGFEASGHGANAGEQPAAVLNSIMSITRAGGKLGIPGLYVTGDPGAPDPDAKEGTLKVRLGLGWAKSHAFTTGQCPVLRYNRGLMMSILHGKAQIAKAVNVTAQPHRRRERPRVAAHPPQVVAREGAAQRRARARVQLVPRGARVEGRVGGPEAADVERAREPPVGGQQVAGDEVAVGHDVGG